MSAKFAFIAAIAAILAALPARAAKAADHIDWMIANFPPAHVVAGEAAGSGTIDQEVRYLKGQMADFIHDTRETSNIRAWALLKDHDGICIPSAIDLPERRRYALFTRHIAMASLAPQLLVRRDQSARVAGFRNAAGEVDLHALAADPSLRAARTNDRPLGAVIEQFAGAARVANLPTSGQAVAMLDKGHVDYVFGYANEITYYRFIHPDSAEMTAIPIAGQPRILYTRVACSDGPIGRRAIARVDEILGQAGTPPPYFEATGRWYEPEDFRELSTKAEWSR